MHIANTIVELVNLVGRISDENLARIIYADDILLGEPLHEATQKINKHGSDLDGARIASGYPQRLTRKKYGKSYVYSRL
jgi:hypothetical protein